MSHVTSFLAPLPTLDALLSQPALASLFILCLTLAHSLSVSPSVYSRCHASCVTLVTIWSTRVKDPIGRDVGCRLERGRELAGRTSRRFGIRIGENVVRKEEGGYDIAAFDGFRSEHASGL